MLKKQNFLKSYSTKNIVYFLFFSLMYSSAGNTAPGDWFEETTSIAGINRAVQTFGISWGDVNGDGWPDAYVSNHWRSPSLYVNQRDGTFLESSLQHDLLQGGIDVHSALWADYDNDGDQDLLTVIGSTIDKLPFFENVDGRLNMLDPAVTGLDWVHSDRMPLWFDQDNDGDLDVMITSVGKTATSAFYSQISPGKFQNTTAGVGFFNVIGSGSRLIKSETSLFPHVLIGNGRAFNIGNTPWVEVTDQIFSTKRGAHDWLYGDIDEDGCMDLYAVKPGVLNQLKQSIANTRLELSTRTWINNLSGLDFNSATSLSISTGLSLGYQSIRLGANSELLDKQSNDLPVIIDVTDSRLNGAPTILLQDKALLYIWRDSVTDTWYLRFGSSVRRRSIDLLIDSVDPVANLKIVNVDLKYYPHQNKFKKGDCLGNYVEVASDVNITGPSLSGVLADFDNDMDLDLYLANKNPVDNSPNQFFENLGGGQFQELANGAGAAGSTLGNGGYVSAADYDMDGFLDLFVLNGKTDFTAGGGYLGPHQLFRNVGNTNNWIEIDLEGSYSNRDAIGAFVELYAGGKKQIRYQGNGAHSLSQDFKRLHFGLAQNEKVDKIIVTWPSGNTSKIINIRGNQLIRIREDEKPFIRGQSFQYLSGAAGIYLWKETYDGPYKLRVMENGAGSIVNITVLATGVPENITGVNLEADDLVDLYPYGFQLTSNESLGEDGVDFKLPPGSKAIVSVMVNGKQGVHHLSVGNTAFAPLPNAWIVDVNTLNTLPLFDKDIEIGTFMGAGPVGGGGATQAISYRWSSARKLHMNQVSVIGSGILQSVQGVNLEAGDVLKAGSNWVEVDSSLVYGVDGLDFNVDQNAKIAFSILQDGLFTPEKVNRGYPGIEKTNAFGLMSPGLRGDAPAYDAFQEAGLFIWKDTNDVWHLRTTAGGGFSMYKGQITTSSPVEYLTLDNLESSDAVVLVDSNTITFDTRVGQGWYDGIDFKLTGPGSITLTDSLNTGTGSEFPVFVGDQKWPVVNLPVELSEEAKVKKWYGPQ